MTKLIQSLKDNKRGVILTLSAFAVLLLTVIIIYVVKTNNRIAEEREQIAAATRVDVQETQLRAPATDGFTAFLNSSDVRATASLSNQRYLATSGGLLVLDGDGNLKRRYTTTDGLTDNDLTALAVFNNKLFIGTATSGMMSFDGNSFTGYRFVKPKASRVSAMLATESELLIGTLDGGLFEYDGARFVRRLNSATGADFSRVTALLANNSRIYVGTQDKGLYVWREAHIEHFGTSEGLPSPRVTGLAVTPAGGSIAIATDFGVVALNDANEIKEISKQPNITSLAASGGRLWAGLFSGGVVQIGSPGVNAGVNQSTDFGHPTQVSIALKTAPTNVYAGDGKLFALTQAGAFERDEQAKSPAFENVSSALASDRALTSAHITSLALDDSANLWIGYFDRGLDIIAPETKERLLHIEDDRVREVNFIAMQKNDDRAYIATSRGLVQMDSRYQQTLLTREQGGLIDNAIAHISFANDSSSSSARGADRIVLATAGGLTDISNNRPRSLTAFHGLSSNHLYTSASIGSRLFAGSLAGLVELEGLRVVRTYKTSNSKLSHDWVTALTEADGTLYIGTNGGGVDALLPTGEWVNFADDMGKFEVNQNAMHFDGEKLYVGTSDRGVLVYNTRERRWTRISAGLTSQNVTAITSDDRFIYVGTLNGLTRIEKRVIQ
jgi:ligand-binding sensor domain-containing protein